MSPERKVICTIMFAVSAGIAGVTLGQVTGDPVPVPVKPETELDEEAARRAETRARESEREYDLDPSVENKKESDRRELENYRFEEDANESENNAPAN